MTQPTRSVTISGIGPSTIIEGDGPGIEADRIEPKHIEVDLEGHNGNSHLRSRTPFVPRPCPCTMEVAMYFLGGSEVLVYLILISTYTSLYNTVLDPTNVSPVIITTSDAAAFTAKLCMIHVILGCLHIFCSVVLIIGVSRRNMIMCGTWMTVVSFIISIRSILICLMPIRVFVNSWGFIWIVTEVYYIYVVGCFILEVRAYPQGYTYKGKQKSQLEEFSESEMRMVPIEVKQVPGSGEGGRIPRFQQVNRRIVYYEILA